MVKEEQTLPFWVGEEASVGVDCQNRLWGARHTVGGEKPRATRLMSVSARARHNVSSATERRFAKTHVTLEICLGDECGTATNPLQMSSPRQGEAEAGERAKRMTGSGNRMETKIER